MIDTAAFGERVRRLRLASGMSQTELGHHLGSQGNTMVSKIENGRIVPEDSLVGSLASALGCSTEYLRRPGFDGLATKPWLRAYADASAKVVDSVLADNLLAFEFVTSVGLRWVPDTAPFLEDDPNDDDSIERFAGELRAAAGIDEGSVVRNAMRAAERLGCSILPLESELGRHMGLSQRINGRPFIRVSKPSTDPGSPHSVSGDRQRFTVAHELGHLTMHAEAPPPRTPDEAKRLEKQAHRFAAAFLAPATPLMDDWSAIGGRVTLGALQKLKAQWGVSIKMLVVRFRHLDVIDDDQARSLYRQISARGWNREEPVLVSTEEPIWLAKALSNAFPSATLNQSVAQAAKVHGLDARYVESWTSWATAEQPTGSISQLSDRSFGQTNDSRATTSRGAKVVQLAPLGQRHRP